MLKGLIRITPKVHADLRGFFLESYQKARYEALGIHLDFAQDNHSYSKQNVLRGMHFQPGQAKLIYCARGKIFDVAVDIRKNSQTFGKWEGIYLDGDKHEQFFIPDGFAHGFCVLSEDAHVIYKVSTPFDASKESGFRFDDTFVNIQWPISNPILSERDKNARRLDEVLGSR